MATKILKLETEMAFTKIKAGIGFKKLVTPGLYNDKKLIKSWYELERDFSAYQLSLELENPISLTSAIEKNYTPKSHSLILPFFSSEYFENTEPGHLFISSDVTNIGSLAFSSSEELDTKIQAITIPHSVKTIGAYAFFNFCDLTYIEIPNTVLQFDDHIFSGCAKLEEVHILAKQKRLSDYTFQDCVALKKVTLAEGTTIIGSYCFANCSAIESIELPNSIEYIEDSAFHNCANLNNISGLSNVYHLGDCVFYGCVNLSNIRDLSNVQHIGEYAFYGCNSLTKISLPNVQHVGEYAFYGCNSLAKVSLSNVQNIEEYAFYGCNSLAEISLSSVVKINAYSFYKCQGLQRILFGGTAPTNSGEGVEIGQQAFYGCTKLETILPSASTIFSIIDTEAFGNCTSLTSANWEVRTIKERAFKNCQALHEANFLTATTIEKDILQGCGELQTLSVPYVGKITDGKVPESSGADTMLGYFFGQNPYVGGEETQQTSNQGETVTYYIPSSLASVTLGEKGTKIHQGAFENCKNIIHITLGQSDYSVGVKAFYGCERLESLDLSKATTIAGGAIGKCGSLTELTLPFIGQKKNTTSKDSTTLFGFIFESATKDGEVYISQDKHYVAEQSYWTGSAEGINGYYIPESLETVNIAVGPLYYGSFSGCKEIKSINIKAITTIPEKAFLNCTALKRFDIPQEVTSIGASAFQGCSSFSSITISAGITSIGNSAFADCTKVSSLTLDSASITGIDTGTFKLLGQDTSGVTVAFGNSVTTVPSNFFYNESTDDAAKITRVVLHDNIESLGDSAFKNCTYLTNLTIPNSIETLTANILAGCTSLVSIVIPDSITTIETHALSGCSSLLGLTLPDSLESVGQDAFANCSSLKTVRYNCANLSNKDSLTYFNGAGQEDGVDLIISASITSIPQKAFEGLKIRTIKFEGAACQEFGADAFANNGVSTTMEVYIPDVSAWIQSEFANANATPLSAGGRLYENGNEVTECTVNYDIGDYVFYGCESIEKVIVDQGAKEIGDYAFSGCTQLNTLEFTEDSELETIGTRSFSGCEGLTEVNIPSTVGAINESAFAKCKSITTMTLPFVGGSNAETSANAKTQFGYIFGTEDLADDDSYYAVTQYYDTNNSSTYYIPKALTNVKLNSEQPHKLFVGAFDGCKNLTNIEFNQSVDTIEKYAFRGCESLTDMAMVYNSDTLKEAVFQGCKSLQSVYFGKDNASKDYSLDLSGFVTIENNSFDGCEALQHLYIPSTLLTIGVKSFYNCKGLVTIYYNSANGSDYASNAYVFGGIGGKEATLDNESVIINCNVYIGPQVVTLPGYTFASELNNRSHILIDFSQNQSKLTTIGICAFWNAMFDSIDIPTSVTTLNANPLAGCSELVRISLPFVGKTGAETSATSASCFGYIFGYDSNSTASSIIQYFGTSNTTSTRYQCQVPPKLQEIEIKGGNLWRGAFSGINTITKLTIPHLGNTGTETASSEVTCLGYLFGRITFDGAQSTQQCYNSAASITFYIPASLKSITVTGGNVLYGAFYNCSQLDSIMLPLELKEIPPQMAYNCSRLTSMVIPDGVTKIQWEAFRYCSNLNQIIMPNDLQRMQAGVFKNCNSLVGEECDKDGILYLGSKDNPRLVVLGTTESFNITTDYMVKEQVTVISEDAFAANSANLKRLIIPNNVLSVNQDALSGCTGIETLSIPFVGWARENNGTYRYPLGSIFGTNENTGEATTQTYITSGTNTTSTTYYIPASLKKVSITDSGVPQGAFQNCHNIEEIVLPDSLTRIEPRTFDGCSALNKINIPTNVLSIGNYAFVNCWGIQNIVIPSSVINIDSYVFTNCWGIQNIVIPKTVTTIAGHAFKDSAMTILCESESQPSGWSTNWNGGANTCYWSYSGQEVHYHLCDDNNEIIQTYLETGSIKLPYQHKDGKYFLGWYTNQSYSGNPVNFDYYSNDDVVLYGNWGDNSMTPSVGTLTTEWNLHIPLDTEIKVNKVTSSTFAWYIFEAPETGEYVFYSTSKTSGDPYVELYSYRYSSQLAVDDDSSTEGNNFSITYNLKKGQRIMIKCRAHSTTQTSYSMFVTKKA